MASTPEGKVKDKISKMLREHGVWYHMPVPGGYGKTALDYICCYHGLFFSIEAKRPGAKPTDRQESIIADIKRAEGIVFTIDGVNGQLEALYLWLSSTSPLDRT
jgi:hypothetical protein